MKEKRYKNSKIVLTESGIGRLSLFIDDDNCAYISQLSVNKKYWGKGWGSKLLSSAIELCKNCHSVRLHVGIDNHRAISLYERHGFFKICIITDKTHWFMGRRI